MAIAPRTQPRSIDDVAADAGLGSGEYTSYGGFAAKVDLDALEARSDLPDGKLVAVTSMTPTKRGEGKTTTAIALTEALALLGRHALLCLREPSLGPVFGIEGGGTGGGLAQLVPMDRINLHFTGDLHAIGAANNLLAAMLDSHLFHGNALGVDPGSISWRRCVDMDDRSLRRVTVVGGGEPRETGFDITAASEVMAVVAVAADHEDLRRRLGAITVARTVEGEPVTAEALGAAGAMAALLADALRPNLVQTLDGEPALVHCGPFANIAHGNNSLIADRLALKLGEIVVTESGFGADMGFEKLVDIVCRRGGFAPSAVVVVATTEALREHGSENLAAHLRLVCESGLDPVVAVNRFPGDTRADVEGAVRTAEELGARAVGVSDGYERGGVGATAVAEAVLEAVEDAVRLRYLYPLDAPITEKLGVLARRAYGAAGVELSPLAKRQAAELDASGLGSLPLCVAKTHLSLSHDPAAKGAPQGFTLPVRELRPYTGAGWVVAVCGDMQTMAGLPADPAARRIDVAADGAVVGLR